MNFAYNKNKIVDLQYKENLTSRGLSLAGMSGDYSNLWIIGQPIDINYNLMTLGVWQLDEAEEAAKYGCKPGQYKPLDLNEDGVIDDKDRVIDGKRTPDWTGGMTNTFTYKEFDLSFQAAFQAGARARNQFYVSYALENNNLNFNNLRKDYWTPEILPMLLHSLVTWVLIEARQDHGEMQNRKCHIRCFPVISLRFLILLWDILLNHRFLRK